MMSIRWERNWSDRRIVVHRLGPFNFKWVVYRLDRGRGVMVASGTSRSALNAKVRAYTTMQDERQRQSRWPHSQPPNRRT